MVMTRRHEHLIVHTGSTPEFLIIVKTYKLSFKLDVFLIGVPDDNVHTLIWEWYTPSTLL